MRVGLHGDGRERRAICKELVSIETQRGINETNLGLSGMNWIPTPRRTGHARPIPTSVCQEPAPEMERVPIAIQSARRI